MMTNRLNRREFLGALAISGTALCLARRGEAALERAALPNAPFAAEGARLTQACMNHYWDKNSKMFRAPVLSSETVSSDALHDRGYTLWASLLGLHALVEGEKSHSGRYARQIAMVFDGLEQGYSRNLRAYTAWVQFPGNVDAYYDDNSCSAAKPMR